MKRFHSYSSIFGRNWLIGVHLFPLLKRWGAEEKGILLDLGCGESPYKSFFPHVKKYLRIDRNKIDDEVITGDLINIPLPDETVDMVLLFQALADLPEPLRCLKEVHRVLRQGGRIMIFESMSYPEHDLPHDYYRIMPPGIEFLTSQCGFQREEIHRLGGLFTRFGQLWNIHIMGKLINSAILSPLGRFGIFLCNGFCYSLDTLFPRPALASDYISLFVKKNTVLSQGNDLAR